MTESVYRDLVNYIQKIACDHQAASSSDSLQREDSYKNFPICLQTQFFTIIRLPDFVIDYVSSSIYKVLGIRPERMKVKTLYSLIHPDDLPIVVLASKKLIEFLYGEHENIPAGELVASLGFRVRKGNGYIKLLNQNSLICRHEGSPLCKVLCLYTDISYINNSGKINFDLRTNYTLDKFKFPDEELYNLANYFTTRECQILSLLASGRNSEEIGEKLFISRHTVDTHRRKMLAKSHLCNTAELVAFAIDNQLL
ncbi:LuxR C-terminal-related transcriptional regulator [Carboxylicivirga sp. M1479]|uniref:LuxR C-terminal-related transcriptional regulator n=1 Tax=Carboxylicivirga sp. M1479 TaxID=2594476 RepID=UPI001177EE76|nr:LuxR C-terminal-related transcriptional regulator [Carboxylicivirga sp. M1479]TRX72481.1 hypothetical protein FNN09_00655 [Carboxylicivirga sp. M1479]